MERPKEPTFKAEPKRPSPMMETESPLSLRDTIRLLTPHWLKRAPRNDRDD
jgi:hypothetical protein